MRIEETPGTREGHDKIDAAVRDWASAIDPEVTVTGWVLYAVGIDGSNSDLDAATYMRCRSTGMQHHAAVGMHLDALHDLQHPNE